MSFVIVGLAGCVLTGSALAQDKDAAVKFTTAKQAHEAWQKSTDETGRQAALEWLESFTLSCPPPALAESLACLGRAASTGKSREIFLAVCAKRGAPEADAAVRQDVALQLADWQMAAGNYEAAAAALTNHLKSADLPIILRSTAVRKAATILSDNLNRPAEAAALLATTLAATPPEKDPTSFSEMGNARAALLHVTLHDAAGAETETRRVLALGSNCPPTSYAIAVDRLVMLLAETGRTNEVVAALLLVFRHPALPAIGCARKLIDAGSGPAQMDEAVGLLRSHVAIPLGASADTQLRIERLQPDVVELLLALGRPDEAVRECRVFALGASDRVYPQAIELAARCLKSLDGDLGRANALLAFHGTVPPPPGSSNILFAFSALSDPIRTEAAKQTEKPLSDWQSWINRAAIYSWLDRPADSMEAARAAFACCPMSSNTLQICANAVARPVLVATRDPALGQRLADFLLTGAAGPDGRQGTQDDIADPFPEARRRLSYTGTAPAPVATKTP
jgi:tetratricopeptide (TPR) repeat protein